MMKRDLLELALLLRAEAAKCDPLEALAKIDAATRIEEIVRLWTL